jgi:hypothetical protein
MLLRTVIFNVWGPLYSGNKPLVVDPTHSMISMQVLRELLDVGAPVDLTCEAGWTPLHRACLNGHAAVAHELVVARKANMLAATKDGRTPILLAAQGEGWCEYAPGREERPWQGRAAVFSMLSYGQQVAVFCFADLTATYNHYC